MIVLAQLKLSGQRRKLNHFFYRSLIQSTAILPGMMPLDDDERILRERNRTFDENLTDRSSRGLCFARLRHQRLDVRERVFRPV
jgi:hypothetical protein